MRHVLASFIVLAALIPSLAWSQSKADASATPVQMKAAADLTLRKAPPSGPLNASGDLIGTVNKGDTVLVTDHKTVHNLFGNYTYARVQVLDPSTHKPKASGWVYAGDANNQYLKRGQ